MSPKPKAAIIALLKSLNTMRYVISSELRNADDETLPLDIRECALRITRAYTAVCVPVAEELARLQEGTPQEQLMYNVAIYQYRNGEKFSRILERLHITKQERSDAARDVLERLLSALEASGVTYENGEWHKEGKPIEFPSVTMHTVKISKYRNAQHAQQQAESDKEVN